MRLNKQVRQQDGFTLTELSLSMTMLAIMLIILLLSILAITSTYNKGLTLKRVNQSGRTVGEDIQKNLRTFKGSGLQIVTKTAGSISVVTRLCNGETSYIWSVYGKDGNAIEKFSNNETITFVKVEDSGAGMCLTPSGTPTPPLPDPDKAVASSLLDDGLVIREPSNIVISTDGSLVNFQYTIATRDSTLGDEVIGDDNIEYDVTGQSPVCNGGKEGEFCALNTFIVTSYVKGVQ